MSKFKEKILNFVKKVFDKKVNVDVLSPSQYEIFLTNTTNNGIIRDFEREINTVLNITKLDSLYGKKLETKQYVYNLPMTSKLSESHALELAKRFFASLGTDLSKKILDDKNSNFNEIYCPQNGDLRDLYSFVHKITHTFDIKDGENETRQIFGEVAPQCMEIMLDDFLLNLSNNELQQYKLNKNTLIQDVRKKQISNFLFMKDNVISFNNGTGNKQINLSYILAQAYSTQFMKLNKKDRQTQLFNFIECIKNNDFKACSKSLGIDLSNELKIKFVLSDVINNVKNTYNQILLQEKLQEILSRSKKGKDFKVSLGNQNIHINLESKIPFILITPSHLKDGQILVMESNNMETNNTELLLKQALGTGKELNDILKGSNPILIPILPSPSPTAPYYQQLSAECFKNGERPDLYILETINKAKEIMNKEYNIRINDKIFLNGYSSSGCFAQRFSLIHPELIDTACIGGASGSIPIPNEALDYPLGIKNYNQLFGKKFELEEYKKIVFDYYVGEFECTKKATDRIDDSGNPAPMHDMSYFSRSVPTNVGNEQRKIYGKDMFQRVNNTVEILKQLGITINHKIIPNRTHNDTEAIELIKFNSNYQGVRGLHSEQNKIISNSFSKMIFRQQSKDVNQSENDFMEN